ncbi:MULTISPECIES: HAMP domain-containing sensor histidine kinase [unclassified Caballeronia]|uniref:sensor histidine kinase n=1 Tax=unclassified Caballeronia TaxID=2646786 RepID=UPI00285E4C7B|nr:MULTISPECIES: HAMP domain-containing sensor histidine kinase [unclassified Caballeronia]MDR5753707.1 HAMP domain-containing sensor histidine kinase [Caballeronia sp. LZ024]MDR5840086.1 HAMP domain-containing sensor histidine kinase [Caballeronia sp. LZ031]
MSDTSAGELQGLVATLRAQQTALTERWMKLVFGDAEVEHSDQLTYRQLADHLPSIFEEICIVLERRNLRDQEGAIERNARQHGQWRWQQGYRIDELVRELDLFRQVLLAAIGDYASAHPAFHRDAEERARLMTDEVVSFVTLASIREAVSERDRKIDEYTGMLERANHELTLRQRLIGDLYESRMQVTRRVAHDLRNFLNVFSTALQLAGRAPAKKDAALALANRQVADMTLLVDEMVEYSKVLNDDAVLTVEPFDLTGLFDELMQASRSATEAKGLKLSGHIDPGLSVVTSNRLKLKQVAYNLLSNAIKYTSSGEVSLTMTAVAEGQWRLRVADTGVGIGADDQERVFEEFERAASDDIPGTGLGLAIVKELSRALKGDLRFQSFKGSGSVFEVVFPVTLDADGDANSPNPSDRAP